MSLGVVTSRAHRPGRCPCGCGLVGLCERHRARLAPIRLELSEDGLRFGDRRLRKGSGRGSTCCRDGCLEPRLRAEHFCAACHAEGFEEPEEVA